MVLKLSILTMLCAPHEAWVKSYIYPRKIVLNILLKWTKKSWILKYILSDIKYVKHLIYTKYDFMYSGPNNS